MSEAGGSDYGSDDSYDSRVMGIEAVRATESAAVAASKWTGSGDGVAADQAAVDALREALNRVKMRGRVVIGEGERDKAPMLYVGEELGRSDGKIAVDIATDPLEGTALCVTGRGDSLSVLAAAPRGGLLNAPDVYMNKLACGSGVPEGVLHLDEDIEKNILALAKFRAKSVAEVTVCVLERERHKDLIEKVRTAGAKVKMIHDGDIFGVIATTDMNMGIDMYAGTGGAPEGVLAAAALRCTLGFMQARLVFRDDDERGRATRWGISDFDRVYGLEDMAGDDVVFAATGVTDGQLLKGVKAFKEGFRTHSVMMRAKTGTIRFTESYHHLRNKSWLAFRSRV